MTHALRRKKLVYMAIFLMQTSYNKKTEINSFFQDLTYMIDPVLMHRGWLPLSKDFDVAYGMLRSLAQSTYEGNGTGGVTWHCGQLPDVHNRLCQDGHQRVSLKESPTLYTEIRKKKI